PCHAYADTVCMKNGDRITGDIQSLQAGKLTIISRYAGAIHVDWSEVQELASSSKLNVQDEQARAEYFSRLKSEKGTSLFAASMLNQPAPPIRDSSFTHQRRSLWDKVSWKGNFGVG